ncbi:MAG: DEAD/DEAH box helicase, partial [Nitrospirota bacterium]
MPIDFALFRNNTDQIDSNSRIYNLTGSSAGLLLALYEKPFLAVEPTEERAGELHKDITFYREALRREPVLFLREPDGAALSGERAKTVFSLGGASLVTSVGNLEVPLWSEQEMREKAVRLARGPGLDRSDLENRLEAIGYKRVSLVSGRGEYSRHGWIVDVFPSTAEAPIRIEFFGDVIEHIKTFEVDTQRSVEEETEYLLFPAEDPASGVTLFDIMADARCVISDSLLEREGLRADSLFFSRYSISGPGHDAGTLSMRGLGIFPQERKGIEDLHSSLKTLARDNRIILVASSGGQADRMRDILRDGGIVAPVIPRSEVFVYDGIFSVTIGDISSGLFIAGLLILTEKELFGERPAYRPLKKSKVSKLLTSLDDLRPGDFVVHKDHGIGRFFGLYQQTTEGVKEDLLLIEYEGGRLYIPLQNINRIHKYHAEENVVPKIDRLGGKTWQKTKERVREKIQQMAEKLLALYAYREVVKGLSFSPDTELHREFDSFFPYEETPDQIKAIDDIKKDMVSDRPMDRLICGDVGYGKTEVAMRAAFRAVYDGCQAAVLVPTTILCEQHYRTFQARFSAFPVRIDYLSRFKSGKEQKSAIKAIASGDVDIVIGTHSLLGKDVSFHKLGLLVIDEEHRFGVRQKEKIKELKKGVDVITLTATPIPRTLSMALSDIRDMSLIETPPEDRLAVTSVV